MSKYKNREIKIEKMWLLKTINVPVILGTLGLIKKGTNEYINKIAGNPCLYEIQKTQLYRTAHQKRVLSI